MSSDQMLQDDLRRALGEAAASSPFEPELGSRARARIRILQSARILGTFVVLGAVGVAVASGMGLTDRPVIEPGGEDRSPVPSLSASASGSIDATFHGWRFAPHEVLLLEGLDRSLDLDCEPREVGGDAATELDIAVTYLPSGLRDAPDVIRWGCDGRGLSVLLEYAFESPSYGAGSLRIERAVYDQRGFGLHVSERDASVGACRIRGLPAVCVRDEEDEEPMIVIIEDDVLDPFAVVLLVDGSGLPYEELLRIAEGIRPLR